MNLALERFLFPSLPNVLHWHSQSTFHGNNPSATQMLGTHQQRWTPSTWIPDFKIGQTGNSWFWLMTRCAWWHHMGPIRSLSGIIVTELQESSIFWALCPQECWPGACWLPIQTRYPSITFKIVNFHPCQIRPWTDRGMKVEWKETWTDSKCCKRFNRNCTLHLKHQPRCK